MLRNIILALFAFIVIGLIVVWIIGGGPRALWHALQSFSLTDSPSGEFALPWQPANLFPAIDEEDLFGDASPAQNTDAELADIERQYDQIVRQTNDIASYGTPSPYAGAVRLLPYDSYPQGGADEYVTLHAQGSNTAPISLAGWSLDSPLSGAHYPVPLGASLFMMNAVNDQRPISLSPGHSIFVASGPSPVGASFRENACTGYLTQYQAFSPPLNRECPSPMSDLPLTTANAQQYGQSCFDFAATLPTCELPQTLPPNLTPNCQAFVQTRFSHNGCVDAHQRDPDFLRGSWRTFLGQNRNIWHDAHDVIRLLDADGRVVDVLSY